MSKHRPPKITNTLARTIKDCVSIMQHIKNRDQECMLAITLSADRRLIGKHLISLGSFHDTDFDIPVLINRIIQDKAHGVVVGHNHPTGLGIFSYDDVISTMKILFVCNMINITLYDHLLFPYNKSYSSMKRKWPKLFKLNYGHVFYKAFDKHIPRLVKEEMKDHESQVH